MLGTLLRDRTYSGSMPAMLKQVGLKIKTIVSMVSQEPEDLAKLSDKVLGWLYNPREDRFGIKFVFNPSKKKKGIKTKPHLTLQDIDKFYESPQSRRSLLSLFNGIYDPLGLTSPYTIKLKLLMKETLSVDNPGDWDMPVSRKLIKEWSLAVKEGIQQDALWFPWTTTSPQSIKKVSTIGLSHKWNLIFTTVVHTEI